MHVLDSGIECTGLPLIVLEPERNKTPTHHDGLAALVALVDDRHLTGWKYVDVVKRVWRTD